MLELKDINNLTLNQVSQLKLQDTIEQDLDWLQAHLEITVSQEQQYGIHKLIDRCASFYNGPTWKVIRETTAYIASLITIGVGLRGCMSTQTSETPQYQSPPAIEQIADDFHTLVLDIQQQHEIPNLNVH